MTGSLINNVSSVQSEIQQKLIRDLSCRSLTNEVDATYAKCGRVFPPEGFLSVRDPQTSVCLMNIV